MGPLFTILPLCSATLLDHLRLEYLVISCLLYEEKINTLLVVFSDEMNILNQLLPYYKVYFE